MPAKPLSSRLCNWPASGPLAGLQGGGRGGRHQVSQLASVPCEFLCPAFFQIYSDEHTLYNEAMQSFNKIVFVILYSISGQSGAW